MDGASVEHPTERKRTRRASTTKEDATFRVDWDFLKHNKKWWLTPIILVLLLFGVLLILGGTAAAPFIYTLF